MCTAVRFNAKDGSMVFGRNLDWIEGYGQHIVAMPKGYGQRWSFEQADKAQRALIGMGIVVDGLPLFFDCANEDGLAVAGLNFPGYAAYEDKPVEGKTNVAAYEMPWWIASNFTSVDQLESALANVAVVSKAPKEELGVAQLHWIVADKERSIVVEYTADGMNVFDNTVDVLANQPGFGWHLENLRNYMAVTSDAPADVDWHKQRLTPFGSGLGMLGLPGEFSSPARFVRAAFFNSHYPTQDGEKSNVVRLFRTLGAVQMIEGGARVVSGEFEITFYTGGFSAKTRTYYYSDYDNPAIRSVCMDEALAGADGSKLVEIHLEEQGWD